MWCFVGKVAKMGRNELAEYSVIVNRALLAVLHGLDVVLQSRAFGLRDELMQLLVPWSLASKLGVLHYLRHIGVVPVPIIAGLRNSRRRHQRSELDLFRREILSGGWQKPVRFISHFVICAIDAPLRERSVRTDRTKGGLEYSHTFRCASYSY